MKKENLLPLVAFVALVLVWGLEILYFQATSINGFDLSSWSAWQIFGIQRTTLVFLTFVSVGCCLLAFPRWLNRLLFIGNICFFILVSEYSRHFGRPLMLQTILYQSGDLLRILNLSTGWISLSLISPLIVVFALKWLLSSATSTFRHSLGNKASVGALGVFVLYGSVIVYDADRQKFTRKNLQVMQKRMLYETIAEHYGYLPTWLANALIVNPPAALKSANSKRNLPARRLISAPSNFELPENIVAIQLESVDFDLLHFSHQGKEVLPFLNQMSQRGIVFKIIPSHINGSADADFIFLNRIEPSDFTINYRLLAFEYKDTTPELFKEKGYQTVFLHNFGGKMYDRRRVFKQIHFDQIYFREELSQVMNVPVRNHSIADGRMLYFSSQLHAQSQQPMFHFMITFTTHAPFDRYPKTDDLFISAPREISEHYFNGIYYLDSKLSEFVASLPEGSLLLLYADHESGLKSEYLGPEQGSKSEHVPAILFQKGRDLAVLRESLDRQLLLSGKLDMLDLSRFFYELIKKGQLSN